MKLKSDPLLNLCLIAGAVLAAFWLGMLVERRAWQARYPMTALEPPGTNNFVIKNEGTGRDIEYGVSTGNWVTIEVAQPALPQILWIGTPDIMQPAPIELGCRLDGVLVWRPKK